MSSIIGQMGQGGGPSLSGIGSWLGSVLPSFGAAPAQAAEAAAGGYGGAPAVPPPVPTTVPEVTAAPTTDAYGLPTGYGAPTPSPESVMGLPAPGGFSPAGMPSPGDIMSGVGADSSGGLMASPVPPTPGAGGPMDANALAGGLANAYLNPTTSGVSTDPGVQAALADPSRWEAFKNSTFGKWLLGDTGAKGAFGSPLTSAGTIGAVMEAINRWNLQQTLQNPSALAKGAAGLYRPMSAAMRRNIIGPVRAEAQETGQINAPGLYSQSVATALAPYQYQMQMKALEDYINALKDSEGAYPQGGLFGPSGLVPQGTYGGGGQSSSTPSQ